MVLCVGRDLGAFFWVFQGLVHVRAGQQRQLADCSCGLEQADGAKSMSVFLALFQLHLPSAQRTFVGWVFFLHCTEDPCIAKQTMMGKSSVWDICTPCDSSLL